MCGPRGGTLPRLTLGLGASQVHQSDIILHDFRDHLLKTKNIDPNGLVSLGWTANAQGPWLLFWVVPELLGGVPL